MIGGPPVAAHGDMANNASSVAFSIVHALVFMAWPRGGIELRLIGNTTGYRQREMANS